MHESWQSYDLATIVTGPLPEGLWLQAFLQLLHVTVGDFGL
jgi:hypothetical protein